jgi:hypothetical protein
MSHPTQALCGHAESEHIRYTPRMTYIRVASMRFRRVCLCTGDGSRSGCQAVPSKPSHLAYRAKVLEEPFYFKGPIPIDFDAVRSPEVCPPDA